MINISHRLIDCSWFRRAAIDYIDGIYSFLRLRIEHIALLPLVHVFHSLLKVLDCCLSARVYVYKQSHHVL
jgi:hypothetical protein